MTDGVLCRDSDSAEIDQPGANCNFTGSTGELEPALFSVRIGRTSLCAEAPLDTSVDMTYLLGSYSDSAFTEPQDVFQTGDMMYLTFDVTNPVATIDEITFNQVNILAGAGASAVTDAVYWVAEPRGAGAYAANIDFTLISEVQQPISPNTPGRLALGFRLLRQSLKTVSTFIGVGSGDSSPLVVQVTVDILYHGNQRRTVHLSHDFNGATVSEAVIVTVMDNPNGDVAIEESSPADGASAASAVSPLPLIMLITLLLAYVFHL